MKIFLPTLILMTIYGNTSAQKVDSIFFHLYTDSLKKGTHNYINVDGKMSNGRWMPLTAKELNFNANAGEFSGTELIVPAEITVDRITVTATLRSNPSVKIEKTIWIKNLPDPPLPPDNASQNSVPRKKKKNN